MFFTSRLYNGGEVDQLMAFFMIHEVSKTLCPSVFEFN